MSSTKPKSMPPKPPQAAEVKFTFDYSKSDVKEVPSLTNLLSRKYLKVSSGSEEKELPATDNVTSLSPPSPPKLPPVKSTDPMPEPSVGGIEISDQGYEQSITGLMSEKPVTQTGTTSTDQSSTHSTVEHRGPVDLGVELSASSTLSPSSSSTFTDPVIDHGSHGGKRLKVQPAARREKDTVSQLTPWEVRGLAKGADPLGKGLAKLFTEGGATGAVFLLIQPPRARGMAPEFLSTAAVEAGHRLGLWTGLRWDPNLVPDLWNYFVKSGYVELSPPESNTNQKSNRNTVRAAFGIIQSEWLTLVRSGPVETCRGVLAIVSKSSVIGALQEVLPLLTSLPPKK